jgi:hypothetical protein
MEHTPDEGTKMYAINFSDQLQQELDERAFATGCDVVELIQVAVIEFMGRDVSPVARRVPDPPLLSTETTAPYDLPRGEATFVTPEIVIDGSARIPDLVGLDV